MGTKRSVKQARTRADDHARPERRRHRARDARARCVVLIDHSGTQSQADRAETLGASSDFARSKSHLEIGWSKTKLTLDYRAGITYTGEVEQDGKTAEVQCNDLAMLDK